MRENATIMNNVTEDCAVRLKVDLFAEMQRGGVTKLNTVVWVLTRLNLMIRIF